MLFTATGFVLKLSELSSQSTHGATNPSIAAELLWGDASLPQTSAFVTMNPLIREVQECSGGNRWLAEMCRVNRVAADDKKVRAGRRVRN
jgi:hypothetical protein